MKLTHKQRAILFSTVVMVMVSTLSVFYVAPKQKNVPKIQGITLKNAPSLANFLLADHQGHPVRREYFLGQWHFIAYGYTQCPDICPTTLFTLTQVADLMATLKHNSGTKFVFYTVDPNRDSQEILAQYIKYFSEEFIAIRANTAAEAEIFQQSLGIKVDIITAMEKGNEEGKRKDHTISDVLGNSKASSNSYQVNHGLAMYLINPEAKLQAVYLPEVTELGVTAFDSEVILADYLRVIKYYQQTK